MQVGDELECRYGWSGRLQLWLNHDLLVDLETSRPIRADADYFAVVDVCFSATSLTLLEPALAQDPVGSPPRLPAPPCSAGSASAGSSGASTALRELSDTASEGSAWQEPLDEAAWATPFARAWRAERLVSAPFSVGMFGVGLLPTLR
ncbi:unnamed protein product [Prorocentrum cordatum]|uniref:Uncharacterized protein n=1 Tax=Prorocentrum cordatum TaxID=2364126 RepID=A0ABN9SZK8_9DINO|nr:unnamed protein product [Polarella glacialis]